MNKIYLNILGLKNFSTEDLERLKVEVEKLNPTWESLLREPIQDLKSKIWREVSKRERSKVVWVEFESYWSGYTSSQRKLVGRFYKKLEKSFVEKLPKYFEHQFSDNTNNAWSVKVVDVRGKDEGSYSQQIEEFLTKQKGANSSND